MQNENYVITDYFLAISEKVENIQTLSDILREQFDSVGSVIRSDEVNLNLLRQIDAHLADIDALSAWAADNFDLTPLEDHPVESVNKDNQIADQEEESESLH